MALALWLCRSRVLRWKKCLNWQEKFRAEAFAIAFCLLTLLQLHLIEVRFAMDWELLVVDGILFNALSFCNVMRNKRSRVDKAPAGPDRYHPPAIQCSCQLVLAAWCKAAHPCVVYIVNNALPVLWVNMCRTNMSFSDECKICCARGIIIFE